MTRRGSATTGGGRQGGVRGSRRRFLQAAAGAAGVAGLGGAPAAIAGLISSPPLAKLNIAGVGGGGMGHGDLRGLESQNIVAVCDVDERRGAPSFQRYSKAEKFHDYRKMLEKRKDIDGVVVAIPDHMHAPVSLMALKLGRHVYCEKPLTHTVYEAREVAKAARAAGVATQMGNRGQATDGVRRLREWIWAGAIGKVREVHVWTDRPRRGIYDEYWPQGVDRPKDTPPVPKGVYWDLWLGVAPKRPYHPAYMPFIWRGWWDFGTGALGDIGCHAIDPVFRALKLAGTHPESVQACSSPLNDETYPVSSIVTWQFPARGEQPPVRLVWYDGGLRPPRPPELEDGVNFGAYTNGTLYVGDEGKMMSTGSSGGPVLIPKSRHDAYQAPPKTIPSSPGHYQEWIDAMKGGPAAGSNFDHAGPLAETVLLGNVALRRSLRDKLADRVLRWDGDDLKFTNCPEANPFVRQEYRTGW